MIQIDAAKPNDFLAVAALDRVAWLKNRNPEFIPDGEHVWRIWCEHALTFVARDGDNIVAAILAFPCVAGMYCVHKVMVAESCRGQGLGSKLFEALLTEIDRRGVDAFLTVDPVNQNAIKLYEKWGFTEKTFVPGFYRANEDRFVLMRRSKK